ncbi:MULTISPECIES: glycosyltransferase [unclassified Microbacterium]|uniref:glycosyltransferase n=1 Tax=unclassified Microbacterium TaxID=2609290 RepID=UPI0012FC62DE|nr:glycosyltransferase [Microbacterium sp. MAH-37]MVQ42628.1 glycosyltransferase [Microbacterium sp. MAH-37]
MTDLVVISLERWDDVWRRNQHLVAGLLAADPDLRVLFVEPPDDPLHAMRRGARPEFGSRLRQVSDRLWAVRPVKWLPRRLDPRTDARLGESAVHAARTLGMQHPLLWVNDPAAAVVARITGWPTLYDMTDDWLAADRPAAERDRIADGEAWLLRHAGAVVACSTELARRKAAQRTDIPVVHNGVDVAAYRRARPRPTDLPDSPVALYLGTLHRDRLDVELCIDTARSLAGRATVVLVGPDALDAADSAALAGAGVLLLGRRARDEVVGYLQHADVLLVPHRVTGFTDSLDPIKLYEYQAVSRPVVSTPVAGFRDAMDPRIRIAERNEFRGAVVEALTRPPAASSEVGPSIDWSARVSEFRDVMRRV